MLWVFWECRWLLLEIGTPIFNCKLLITFLRKVPFHLSVLRAHTKSSHQTLLLSWGRGCLGTRLIVRAEMVGGALWAEAGGWTPGLLINVYTHAHTHAYLHKHTQCHTDDICLQVHRTCLSLGGTEIWLPLMSSVILQPDLWRWRPPGHGGKVR